jgi:hypothetical protein
MGGREGEVGADGKIFGGTGDAREKLTEGAALAGRARNEQPPTQRSAEGVEDGRSEVV